MTLTAAGALSRHRAALAPRARATHRCKSSITTPAEARRLRPVSSPQRSL